MTTQSTAIPPAEGPDPRTPAASSGRAEGHGFAVVGRDLPVKDAVEKVTGALKYAVDFAVPGMAHGKILRSPHPHARILRIDTTRAEALPGVLAVVTHHDAPDLVWENAWFNYRGKVLDLSLIHI